MFFYEGLSCPVCGQTFRETDDIVACPQCGAPHHRECWQREGHCHYAPQHGTDHQWKRPAPAESGPAAEASATTGSASAATGLRECPNCHFQNPEFAEFCSRCGQEFPAADWRSTPPPPPVNNPYAQYRPGAYGEYSPYRVAQTIDPFGGVSRNETIDNVSAEDLVTAIGNNSAYYLTRFYKMSRGGSKCSWNWAAFFFAPFWLLFRKNYLAGGLALLLFSAQSLLNQYVVSFLIAPAVGESMTYAALFEAMQSGSMQLYAWILLLSSFVSLLLRVFVALMGNAIYMRTSVTRVRKLAAEHPDSYQQELMQAGGTSFMLGAVAYAILQFCTMLLLLLV